MGINSKMTALADAVRAKSGVTGKLSIDGMTAAVNGISTGGGTALDFYKCTAVHGPQTIKYLDVSNAGTSDCNGRYTETGELKNGEPVFRYDSSSGKTWYIYFSPSEWDGDYWILLDRLDSGYSYDSYYFSSSQQGNWYSGEYGEGSASVTLSGEVINADQPKTWSGIKAAWDQDKFVYDAVETSDLAYDNIIPKVGEVYSRDCTINASYLYTGPPENSCPVDPTGDKSGDWIISAASFFDSPRKPYKAFTSAVTNDSSDGWHSKGEKPAWIQWQNTREKVLVKRYSVLFRADTAANSGVFLLQGSLDGVNWQTLDTVDNSSGTAEVVRNIDNETSFYFHRILFTGETTETQYIMVFRITAHSSQRE